MTAADHQKHQGGRGQHPRPLDSVDLHLLALLVENGRMSNTALAHAASIAESTCHTRLAALKESGMVRGVHADVDMAVFGRPLEALVSIRIHPGARHEISDEMRRLAALPQTLDVFFLAGHVDLLLRVAVADAAELRDLVIEQLNRSPRIAGTETSIVMDRTTIRRVALP